MNEVVHFTKTPDIKHFAEVKVSPNDNVYGVTWAEVVRNYLKTAYSGEDAHAEVQAFGKTYKVLRRTDVTAFYDKDGNTLFDVTNERLADEYEWLTSNPVSEEEETEDEEEFIHCTIMKDIKNTNMTCSGLGEEKCSECPKAEPTLADMHKKKIELVTEHTEDENLSKEDNGDVVAEDNEGSEKETPAKENGEVEKEVAQSEPEENGEVHADVDGEAAENTQTSSVYIGIVGATTKLQEELKKAKEKEFAEPVIEYLIERCKDSESLAADICQDHKTWEKCYDYIYKQARKTIKGNRGVVRDSVVFEWAEDYFHLDDKALAEQQAKEAAERAKKNKENAQKQKEDQKKRIEGMKKREAKREAEKSEKAAKEDASKKATAEIPKAKPKKGEMDGQLDLFSMMGL